MGNGFKSLTKVIIVFILTIAIGFGSAFLIVNSDKIFPGSNIEQEQPDINGGNNGNSGTITPGGSEDENEKPTQPSDKQTIVLSNNYIAF